MTDLERYFRDAPQVASNPSTGSAGVGYSQRLNRCSGEMRRDFCLRSFHSNSRLMLDSVCTIWCVLMTRLISNSLTFLTIVISKGSKNSFRAHFELKWGISTSIKEWERCTLHKTPLKQPGQFMGLTYMGLNFKISNNDTTPRYLLKS